MGGGCESGWGGGGGFSAPARESLQLVGPCSVGEPAHTDAIPHWANAAMAGFGSWWSQAVGRWAAHCGSWTQPPGRCAASMCMCDDVRARAGMRHTWFPTASSTASAPVWLKGTASQVSQRRRDMCMHLGAHMTSPSVCRHVGAFLGHAPCGHAPLRRLPAHAHE